MLRFTSSLGKCAGQRLDDGDEHEACKSKGPIDSGSELRRLKLEAAITGTLLRDPLS